MKNKVLFFLFVILIIGSNISFASYKTFQKNVTNKEKESSVLSKYKEIPYTSDSERRIGTLKSNYKKIDFYIGAKQHEFNSPLKMERGVLYLPFMEFLKKLTILERGMQTFSEDGKIITVNLGKNPVVMYLNTNTAEVKGKKIDMGGVMRWGDNDVYVPLDFFINAIGYSAEIVENDDKMTVRVVHGKKPNFEKFVNGKNISSKTGYMVWISKSNFRVNIFKGSKNNWKYVDSFECSLGKAEKPTIVGEFEYFSLEDKWDFGYYYVGPVMRFRGPYAMHSTLLKPDGTYFDYRLNMNISKGCVRLKPDDINWMSKVIPLRTKVYVTP
ncbi:L,D-transpeptidase family protein [Fusobacterium sp. PH5-44]|uniref:L,D-transpeptidase family protein n=1 Tax=unclassified Fusobacterium TaxID=2648384 RepID=UPI003D19BC04